MKKTFYLGAALAMALTAGSGAMAQDTNMNSSNNKMQTSMNKNADSKFMMMLATGGMNEIGLSQTALSKSTNDEVKQFAQKMIDDHTAAGDELKSLAATKMVSLPMQMDSKHMEMNTKLSAMSGMDFDMMYIKTMVKDHEKTVSMLQKEANSGKDADAKALAAKLLPTVQGHLDMARSMMMKMSGKSMSKSNMNGM